MTATMVTTTGTRHSAANLILGQHLVLCLHYLSIPAGILFTFPLRSRTLMVNP